MKAIIFLGMLFISVFLYAGNNALSTVQLAKLTAYNKDAWDADSNDHFGISSAIDDDILVIGSYGDDCTAGENCGSAYLYRLDRRTNTIEHIAKLTAKNAKPYHYFGYCVAINGDTIVVGNFRYDPVGVQDGGYAYIFEKPADGWTNMHETAILSASDSKVSQNFGTSVDIDDNTVVVGNSNHSCKNGDMCGAAYIFRKPSDGWGDMNETAKLTASDGKMFDFLGGNVAVNEGTVVLGASGKDCDAGDGCGAAYVYIKPLYGWNNKDENFVITASDASFSDYFGGSVAVNGHTIAIGSPGNNCQDGENCGAIYVFNKLMLTQEINHERTKLTSSKRTASSWLGSSLNVANGYIVSGAPGAACDIGQNCGMGYLFSKSIGGWGNSSTENESAVFSAAVAIANSRFGASAAMTSDGYIVVGAPDTDIVSKKKAGAAYLYKADLIPGYLPSVLYTILY